MLESKAGRTIVALVALLGAFVGGSGLAGPAPSDLLLVSTLAVALMLSRKPTENR
jgi:hypothetical protein